MIQQILHVAHSGAGSPILQAIADMICIAFFYLMRPGEYTGTFGRTKPFCLGHVRLFRGDHCLHLATASEAELFAASRTAYTFDNQKNGVRGEVIGHGRTGQFLCCPVLATVRRVQYLRDNGASAATPLATSWVNGRAIGINNNEITQALRTAIITLGSDALGLQPSDVEARSLRAGGAMALLNGGCDDNIIKLMGRWRSDAMLRYLHGAAAHTSGYAAKMLCGGSYTLLPGDTVPQQSY